MTLQQLEYFLAAYRHGSFSGAAEELRLAQPSVSEQVRRLEAELGVALFARVGRGLAPTEAGETLRPNAERTLADAEAARESVVAVRELRGGIATFGTWGTARYYPGTDMVAEFRRRHPDVRVRLVGQNSIEVVEAVRDGELEAGMVALPIDDRGLDVQPIMRDEIVYASVEPARVRRPATIAGLAGAPLILADASYGSDDPTRRQLAGLAQRAGVTIEPQIDVEDVEAAIELAARGLGDTIVSRGMLLALGRRVPRRLGWAPFAEPIYDEFAFGRRSPSRSTTSSRSSRGAAPGCRPPAGSSSASRASAWLRWPRRSRRARLASDARAGAERRCRGAPGARARYRRFGCARIVRHTVRAVIRYRFGADDLLRTRFAVSPLFELVWSTHVLRGPPARSLHRPWVEAARARLAGFDWEMLDLAINGHRTFGFVPDFVTPPPITPLADLEGELERVRATAPEQVAREIGWRFEGQPVPDVVRPLIDDPGAALDRLVAMMRGYWERAIEPWWPALRAVLEADVVHRARRLAAGGTIDVFAGLHRRVRWHDGVLEVEHRVGHDVDLRGRGLLLVPAAFGWPDVFTMIDEPWQPSLIYTPRGVGELWAPPAEADPAALDALLGRRRAEILRVLRVPASTQDLAERLSASPAGVSEHLGVLRAAGLVRAQRDGRRVLYARTAAGEGVLRAPGAA